MLYNTYHAGGVGTRSRLHVDPGGLDLIIAPFVGWKEVHWCTETTRSSWGAMCSDSAQEVERGKRTPLDELLANETPPSLERNRSCHWCVLAPRPQAGEA